jgi:beta-lactamase class A
VEQLQEQLTSRMIEQDSLKGTVEKLQSEKELQDKRMGDMRHMIDNMFDEMMTKTQHAMMMMIQQHPELETLKKHSFEEKKVRNKTFLLPRYSLLSERPSETKAQEVAVTE